MTRNSYDRVDRQRQGFLKRLFDGMAPGAPEPDEIDGQWAARSRYQEIDNMERDLQWRKRGRYVEQCRAEDAAELAEEHAELRAAGVIA